LTIAVLNGDASVGWRKEVTQVRGGRTETFDTTRIELSDRLEQSGFTGAARARVQEATEAQLVLAVLVDVGNPQLRLPEERVVRPLEDLSLLGDRAHHRLERRSPVQVAERAVSDLPDDFLQSTPDGPEVLQSFFPQEPRLVRGARILPPAFDERTQRCCGHAAAC
jgi:hypothetical protein